MSKLEKIVSLCKRRGFVFPGSEIYGGLGGTWDFGPLGAELKKNIKEEYWKTIVRKREDVVGIDGSIIMSPRVWEASGHLKFFSDFLADCKKCKKRLKAKDKKNKKCSFCGGELTVPKKFNLMVDAYLGSVEKERIKTYLRGEITQNVHINFRNILNSTRVKIPFGVAQIGKVFRNEIAPGGFIFRSREFEQMELQFYIKPDENELKKWYEFWKKERMNWYKNLGIKKENLRFREHKPKERAHYAKAAWDIEYNFENEWMELEGIHFRGVWDLEKHQEFSGENMEFFDETTKEKYLPWIIETSGGVDRAALFFLADAYTEEKKRTVLKLHPKIAPVKVAVFPLLANKPRLIKKAREVYSLLKNHYSLLPVAWDERGNIGKRYFSQDEIGTILAITIDFQTLEDQTATLRDRDTAKQIRLKITELPEAIQKIIEGEKFLRFGKK